MENMTDRRIKNLCFLPGGLEYGGVISIYKSPQLPGLYNDIGENESSAMILPERGLSFYHNGCLYETTAFLQGCYVIHNVIFCYYANKSLPAEAATGRQIQNAFIFIPEG
jgi:hypothetical protein